MPPMEIIVQTKFLMSSKGEGCNSVTGNNLMVLFCQNPFISSIYMAAIMS